jgi:hypothetical protein
MQYQKPFYIYLFRKAITKWVYPPIRGPTTTRTFNNDKFTRNTLTRKGIFMYIVSYFYPHNFLMIHSLYLAVWESIK